MGKSHIFLMTYIINTTANSFSPQVLQCCLSLLKYLHNLQILSHKTKNNKEGTGVKLSIKVTNFEIQLGSSCISFLLLLQTAVSKFKTDYYMIYFICVFPPNTK